MHRSKQPCPSHSAPWHFKESKSRWPILRQPSLCEALSMHVDSRCRYIHTHIVHTHRYMHLQHPWQILCSDNNKMLLNQTGDAAHATRHVPSCPCMWMLIPTCMVLIHMYHTDINTHIHINTRAHIHTHIHTTHPHPILTQHFKQKKTQTQAGGLHSGNEAMAQQPQESNTSVSTWFPRECADVGAIWTRASQAWDGAACALWARRRHGLAP